MATAVTATASLASKAQAAYQGEGAIPWADIIKFVFSLLGGCGLTAKRAALIVRRPILTGHAGDLLDAIGSFPACKGKEYECFNALCHAGKSAEEAVVAKGLAEAQA